VAAATHAEGAEPPAVMASGGPFPMLVVAMPFVAGFVMSKHIECFSFFMFDISLDSSNRDVPQDISLGNVQAVLDDQVRTSIFVYE
jgi:hypothetical protein